MIKRQQGLTTVEAAIGTVLILVVLFGTIEFARAIYVWNFLDEVTRRAARVAAVCPIEDEEIAKNAAIFANPVAGTQQSPHVGALSTSDIEIEYLDAAGNESDVFEDVRFVQAYINSFDYPLLFFRNVTWRTPTFRTILPSESLGVNPGPPLTFKCDF